MKNMLTGENIRPPKNPPGTKKRRPTKRAPNFARVAA